VGAVAFDTRRTLNDHLHISESGLAIEREYEKGPPNISPHGFATKKYLCDAGKPTIGWGHVITSTGDYMHTCTIDETTADKLLAQDNLVWERCIKRLVKVELTQNEFDALCCLLHNIGEPNFANSTLLKKLNANDKCGAADEFPKWNKFSNPKTNQLEVAAGLVRRRAQERALFLGEQYV
jgi:lysozyme